jgi:hypothetical protein
MTNGVTLPQYGRRGGRKAGGVSRHFPCSVLVYVPGTGLLYPLSALGHPPPPGDAVGLGLPVGNVGQGLVVGGLNRAGIGRRKEVIEDGVGRAGDSRVHAGARGRRVIYEPAAVRARDPVHGVEDRDVIGGIKERGERGRVPGEADGVNGLLVPVEHRVCVGAGHQGKADRAEKGRGTE